MRVNLSCLFYQLAHMLERQSSIMAFLEGGRFGILSGDITGLVSDCQALKPTDVPMVPR